MNIKTAKELYPDVKDERYFCICDYQPIVESFGNVILQKDEIDYQGDTWVLYRDGNKIGYLGFGWGSCSGCDALQGCSTFSEIDELIKEMVSDIKWFENAKEALDYFNKKDWEGSYQSRSSDFMDFLSNAKILLEKISNE